MASQYSTFRAELIYIFRINDIAHSGCLKIGKTTILDGTPFGAEPNSHMLNEAARQRIKQYTATAGIQSDLLHTELSMSLYGKELVILNDKDIHNILLRSGIKRHDFGDGMGVEWFECDLHTAKRAIQAAKEKRTSLLPNEITIDQSPIIFRPEQQDAIERTCKKFKKSNQMLWNAKMRFGKTLSALEVVRRMQFKRTIIVTHRPVVDKGWYEDFSKIFYFENTTYMYGSKDNGTDIYTMENACALGKVHYIYFASMQDLRGTDKVGGKFAKNHRVFSTKWDCVIVDEAHEGTQTTLGQNVLAALTENDPKVLQLSGTPFNLFDQYKEDEIFTWDYVMEQKAKAAWDDTHFGDTNPYAGLPAMNIYTFDLGKLMSYYMDMDVAFNFTEFFRTKNSDGSFVHAADVRAFLDLMVKPDPESMFPFSNEEFRDNFHHTLWMVPGVKSAKALSAMLQAHPVFGNFEIVNVAGDGDDDAERGDALELVQKAIAKNDYTITISCGKLTTGVSVPEWTAVFMLSGTFNTAASAYMQTIFRVQTPAKKDGKIKENCYVFDFAPDRTLKVVAETAKVQAKAGRTTEHDRKTLGEFLNFCPIVSCDGTQMKDKITAEHLFEQLKKVYVERVVSSGFEDKSLYNDDLLKLSDIELKQFEELKKIIGETKAMKKTNDIDINQQGLTDEQRAELERIEKKPKKERTPEEEEKLKEMQKAKEQRNAAISILRGISIRMPLLIYGAELTGNIKEVTLDNFADLIDDLSWEEFMPKGINKVVFHTIRKYYDPDIFLAAGKRIRALAEAADAMGVEQRIGQIAAIFNSFRNPDKETVLTPWRVVNMHMSDCLGGYTFYNDEFTAELNEPRYVEQNEVTDRVFRPDAKILEINSKSGLYPLYAAYSIYRAKTANSLFACDTVEEQQRIWDEVIKENIFVICKTPMAKSITKRTLIGFRTAKVNTRYFEDLINQIKNKPEHFIKQVEKFVSERIGIKDMKFNAVVGNPPYQEVVAQKETANGQKRSVSIFQHFQTISDRLARYTSMIYPGARWIHRSGKGLEQFGLGQMNDVHMYLLKFFPDSTDVFKEVGIADGLSIVMKDSQKESKGFKYIYSKGGEEVSIYADNPGEKLFPLNPLDDKIVHCLEEMISRYACLHESVLSQKLFSIESDFVEKNPNLVREYNEDESFDPATEIKLFTNDKAGKSGRARWYIANKDVITTGVEYLDRWKVIVSSANAGGQKRSNQIAIVDNHSAFGRSRVALKTFATKQEAKNFFKYATSEIIRFAFLLTDESLTSLAKKVPDLLDYSDNNGLIDYSGNINEQLYKLFGIDEKNQQHIREVLASKNTKE